MAQKNKAVKSLESIFPEIIYIRLYSTFAAREACFTYFPQHWENSGQNPTPGKICKICERKAEKNKVPREIFLSRVFSSYLKTLLSFDCNAIISIYA